MDATQFAEQVADYQHCIDTLNAAYTDAYRAGNNDWRMIQKTLRHMEQRLDTFINEYSGFVR